MQFVDSDKDKAAAAAKAKGLGGSDAGGGRHSSAHMLLSMYRAAPKEELSIDEFERLALERLRVLKGIEDAKLRGKQEQALTELAMQLTKTHLQSDHHENNKHIDILSHHVLRLAYCSTPALRKWFLTMECELFRIRFQELLKIADDRAKFLKREGLEYTALPSNEMTDDLKEKLKQVQVSCGDNLQEGVPPQIYKVHFTAVPDLVAQRRVYLSAGYAYVSQKDLASLVVQDFRTQLSKGLAMLNRRWREMFPDSDTRLRPLVEGLSQRYLGPDLGSTTAQRRSDLTISNLPAVSSRHFPLCMHNLMQALRRDHHLKHNGRQQLSLFLKSVGLPLEEAMIFWRTEFAPKVPGDKFDKEYAYNIRHNYGKEGKMADYTAHSCVSIVRMTGGADEQHGCPYRRMDEVTLRANLSALGCENARIDEAMQKKAGGHFQVACACAFEGIHKTATDVGINHPAQYYAESRRVWDEREARSKENAAPAGLQGPQPMAVDGTPGGAAAQKATMFCGAARTPASRPLTAAGPSNTPAQVNTTPR